MRSRPSGTPSAWALVYVVRPKHAELLLCACQLHCKGQILLAHPAVQLRQALAQYSCTSGLLTLCVCRQLGAVVYATRVPERWKPGAFDLAGHSHQLFHLAVIAAALVYIYTAMPLLCIAVKAACHHIIVQALDA